MTLAIVRHGAAEGNREHRLIGWLPVQLEERGRAEAEAVADRLAEAGIERIVASDLTRALQTAEPLAQRLGISIERDPRLREIDNGEWTGLLPEEISRRWPELWASYLEGVDVDRPGGESWSDVGRRVTEALRELNGSETTAVFTHAGPVVIAAAWALGIELPGNVFRGAIATAANASITTITAGPTLMGYADVGHLAPLPTLDIPFESVPEGE